MRKVKMKKTISSLLAVLTLMGSILSPVSGFAEEFPEEEKKPPLYEEVKDLLDENEVVYAKNLGIDIGSYFDLENDFSNIEIPDQEAVKITFEEAKNSSGEDFCTENLDEFEAIYYVEPLKTDHPKYQISRKLIIKEPGTEIDFDEQTEEVVMDFIEENALPEEIYTTTENTVLEESMILETEALITTEIPETEENWDEVFNEEIEILDNECTELDETETEIVETEESYITEIESDYVEPEIIVEEEILIVETEAVTETENEFTEGLETEQMESTKDATEDSCDKDFRARLKIVKQDYETGKTILVPNAEFKVYDLQRMEYVEQVTRYPDIYVHESYFTDSDGYLIMPECLSSGNYRIEEVQAPIGYVRNEDAVEICISTDSVYQVDPIIGDYIIEVVVEGQAVKGELTIHTQGESLYGCQEGIFLYESNDLKGAEYEIYAADDIYSSDYQKNESGERNLLYSEGSLVTMAMTDEKGIAVVENLPLGLYEICEKKAPEGYVRNNISKTICLEYKDQYTDVIQQKMLFSHDRQKVEIAAVQLDAENESSVGGAILGLYNKDDIIGVDGKTILQADTLIKKVETGEDGRAVFSADIPFGQYYVKECKAPSGYVSSDEVLYFDAKYQEQDTPVVHLQETKKNSVSTIEVSVIDKNTSTVLNGASITLLDKSENIIMSWTSNKEHSQLIKRLKVGETYILREDFSPYGYLRRTDLEFTVEDTAETQVIALDNDVPTAMLIINNEGEFLSSVPDMGINSGEEKNVTFYVYAAEDIKAADEVSEDYFKKNELIGMITTDSSGIAQMKDLPVGRYYVKAKGAEKVKYIDLSYRDQETAVVTYDEDWQEERQKAVISVKNYDKETKSALSGAVFGLFSSDEIKSSNGKVLIEKDQLIEKISTDENGELMFKAELPVDEKYYVKVIIAAPGYVTDEAKQEFLLEKVESLDELLYEFIFESEYTTVEMSVKEKNSGKEVSGSQMKVINEDGDIVDTWISGTKTHILKGLTVGQTYVVKNILPASGYVTAKKVQFVVENTAKLQEVEMTTDVTKLTISNKKASGNSEVPGIKMSILDENDRVMESWKTNGKVHYVEKLPIGPYRIRIEKAAKGYVIQADKEFEISDSEKVQSVSIISETAKGKVILNVMDTVTEKPLMGVEFELRDHSGNVLETLKTDAAGHAESGLYEIASYKNGEMGDALAYYLIQTKKLQGYVLDNTEYKISFKYEDDNKPILEVSVNLKNNTDTTNPHTPGTATTLAENPKTGDATNVIIPIIMMFGAISLMLGVLAGRKKSK